MVEIGKRYTSRGAVQIIVTKGGSGILTDGSVPFTPAGTPPVIGIEERPTDGSPVLLGSRYRSQAGMVEVLVIKPGVCDLCHDGRPMYRVDGGPGSHETGVPRRPSPGGLAVHAAAPLDNDLI
jgi:hypothetical protein